ncbi:hypothetical protein VTJ04DRAFT_3434 [Mycothermus thermophilus]|uniref:uncharacterized protein n=1 Tax=Humicola insolens TaxID=85995 RepID=UPI0037423C45
MDDTKRLISHLHDELARLDGMVAAYQREMLTEFQKHMNDCLKDCPDDVSLQVSQAIAEAMASGTYASLCPPANSVPGTPIINHSAWDGRSSPPPILPHTSGTPKENFRARDEEEFHELFTPRYLPLLEDREPRRHRSDSVSSAASLSLLAPANPSEEAAEKPKNLDSANTNIRPQVVRSSSVSSTGNDKPREGARRRSSVGSLKDSPRRVRFLVEGQEVFPSSPKNQEGGGSVSPNGLEDHPQPGPSEAVSLEDTSTSLAETPGEEDVLPKANKVSSTQKLRELSRQPLDDTCNWVPSGDDGDRAASPNGVKPTTTQDSSTTAVEGEPEDLAPGAPLEERGVNVTLDNDINVSEREYLTMMSKAKDKDKRTESPLPSPETPEAQASTNTTATTDKNGSIDVDHDDNEDALFDLDEEASDSTTRPSKPVKKYLPDHDSDEEPTTPATPGHRRRPTPTDVLPPVSPSAALFSHSIGSYKGRTVLSTPIKNPKLYDEIANMKDVHFFVGSIDGRSGVEPADLGSYRAASLAMVGGGATAGAVPKSFSERLALEEEMERRKEEGLE